MTRVAIIGTGISGLGAAYLLHQKYDITVYEKNPYIGGHSRTLEVETSQGNTPVDTGFIVFNRRTYPLLTGLFRYLDVPTEKSDMSFAASIHNGWLEYGTATLSALFAQKRNFMRSEYLGMLRDILRFYREAPRYLEDKRELSLEACLDELKLGDWFRQYFLLAVGGAIWSTPLERMLAFPAQTLIRFFHNHGLLTVSDQPQWYTVRGGSREYVARLTESFRNRIRLNCGVERVTRNNNEIRIRDKHGNTETYDKAVFACHSDQALSMLSDPSPEEDEILGAIRYQPNRAILHRDTSLMPRRRACWASWNYLLEDRKDQPPAISLSYWMNRLQNLPSDPPLIVTLNPGRAPEEHLIENEYTFEHPVFDARAMTAQEKVKTIQGQRNTWYCGAWQRYGFHEDGLLSAVQVAEKLGVSVPWK